MASNNQRHRRGHPGNRHGSSGYKNKDGNLTGTLIADLVLQVMAYFAQTERESIRQRQAEGIAAARAKGKRLGRKPIPLPDGFENICFKCVSGELSTRVAAAILDMSHSTFYRNYRIWKNAKSLIKSRPLKTVVSNGRHFKTVML